MKRALFVCLVMAALSTAPTASAAPGWELAQTSGESHDNPAWPITTYASRCGASQFGVWKFRFGMTVRGRQGQLSWNVRVSSDGKAHRARRIRLRGTMPPRLRREGLQLLRDLRYRYTAGPTPELLGVRRDGSTEVSYDFVPVARVCRARR